MITFPENSKVYHKNFVKVLVIVLNLEIKMQHNKSNTFLHLDKACKRITRKCYVTESTDDEARSFYKVPCSHFKLVQESMMEKKIQLFFFLGLLFIWAKISFFTFCILPPWLIEDTVWRNKENDLSYLYYESFLYYNIIRYSILNSTFPFLQNMGC